MIDLAELRAVLSKATPGPWEYGEAMCCPDMGWVCGVVHMVYTGGGKSTHSMKIEDAEAIAAMRNALPALLAELEAARAFADRVRLWAMCDRNRGSDLDQAVAEYDAATNGGG